MRAPGGSRQGRPFFAASLRPMHLRPPSFDHGLVSGIWATLFGLLILFGSISFGVSAPTAIIVALVAGAAIFFFVRFRGQEPLR